jgi:hypothetical protein
LNGTHVASDEANYLVGGTGYNGQGTATASVNITWTGKAIADALKATNPVKFYVVVKYTASAGCADNLKAYSITPVNLFQITVENVNASGGTYADICRANIASATLNVAGDAIDFDYGENAFYLKVTAKYFTTSWTPTIDIAALTANLTITSGNQSIQSIEWARNIASLTGTSNFDLATGEATTVVPDVNGDNVTSGTDEVVYIKVVIDHGKFEGTTAQTLAFNLSAIDAAGNPDVDKDTNCATVAENDNVSQVLKARPAITGVTPVVLPSTGVGPFIPATTN